MANFTWDDRRREAAQLLARGNLSFEAISRKLEVSSRSIYEWRRDPEFMAYVAELEEEFKQAVRRRGIAVLERRVRAQNDRWNRMQRVILERAEAPEMANVPGGTTGLVVRKLKMLGSGENATVVEEFEVDTGLLKEIREVEKLAAQELGQWTEKVESSGGLKIQVEYVDGHPQDPTPPSP